MNLGLPKKVARGDRVRAEDFNSLIDALQSVMLQPGQGYERKVTRAGTVLRIRRPTHREFQQVYPSFAVIEAEKLANGNYEIMLEPGRVSCPDPVESANDGDGWRWFVPTINDIPMNLKDEDGDYPKIEVAPGQWIYCQIRTDQTGMISEVPEMVVDEPEQESVHYQPPDPQDSGIEGVYKLHRIVEVDVNEDDELELKPWCQKDIDLTNQLWEGENLGDVGEVFKEHDEEEGVYKFRGINGNFGIDHTTQDETVDLDFDGENLNDLEGGSSGDIYVEPTPQEIAAGGPAQFRPVTQGPSGRQEIEIAQTPTAVQVMGNNVQGLGLVNGVAVVSVNDGLVTAVGAVQVPALPDGEQGDILHYDNGAWVVLPAPGISQLEGWVLSHDGISPFWLDSDAP